MAAEELAAAGLLGAPAGGGAATLIAGFIAFASTNVLELAAEAVPAVPVAPGVALGVVAVAVAAVLFCTQPWMVTLSAFIAAAAGGGA